MFNFSLFKEKATTQAPEECSPEAEEPAPAVQQASEEPALAPPNLMETSSEASLAAPTTNARPPTPFPEAQECLYESSPKSLVIDTEESRESVGDVNVEDISTDDEALEVSALFKNRI